MIYFALPYYLSIVLSLTALKMKSVADLLPVEL